MVHRTIQFILLAYFIGISSVYAQEKNMTKQGPYPFIINSIKQLSPSTYLIKTAESCSDEDLIRKPKDLYIYIIDPVKEIAVWQYTTNTGEPSYTLYVSEKKARDFDMIVWNCTYQKEFDEFQFDQIDFKKLIEQCKNKQ